MQKCWKVLKEAREEDQRRLRMDWNEAERWHASFADASSARGSVALKDLPSGLTGSRYGQVRVASSASSAAPTRMAPLPRLTNNNLPRMDFSNGNWSPRKGIPVVMDASLYEPGGKVYDQWMSLCAATPNIAFKPPSLATKASNKIGRKSSPMSLVCMEHRIYLWYERIMKTSTHQVDLHSRRIIEVARESWETGRYHSFCLMVLKLAPKPKGRDEESSEEESEIDPDEEVFIRMN